MSRLLAACSVSSVKPMCFIFFGFLTEAVVTMVHPSSITLELPDEGGFMRLDSKTVSTFAGFLSNVIDVSRPAPCCVLSSAEDFLSSHETDCSGESSRIAVADAALP